MPPVVFCALFVLAILCVTTPQYFLKTVIAVWERKFTESLPNCLFQGFGTTFTFKIWPRVILQQLT
jgi:hypothetical protein